jgi:Fibronectin type III domain
VSDTTYAGAGLVGLGIRGTSGRLDDFGARSLSPPTPPAAPTALSAIAGDGLVRLSWSAPSSDGGSPLTGFRIYRGESPGSGTVLASPGPGTSFEDTTASNDVTYYYRVSALNAVGESPPSNEVPATPTGDVPLEPLPTLDSFERPDENPLSDGGRWTNGINGSGNLQLRVLSNRVGGTKTTTTAAWRTNASYGPDLEVWTRVGVLPGPDNHVRLYARLRQPGSTAFDAYMLRTNQLSGADQVFLERIDDGVVVPLLTMSQELAAGDLLLLRVRGSTLEAWHNRGALWARLGTVSDTTYAGAGLVGLGIRGTSGRLDDFGARSLGS